MAHTTHDLCDRSAELILSGEWDRLARNHPIRTHIDECEECRSRIEEVRFFHGVFSTDNPEVFLRKKIERQKRSRTFSPAGTPPRSRAMVALVGRSVAALAACLVLFFLWNAYRPEGIAQIAAIEGEATLQRFAKDSEERLKKGTRVFRGDLIRTGPGARVCLRLEENNRVYLNESTQLVVEAARWLHHNAGEIWLEIERGAGEFEIEARGADVTVLGTSFGVVYSGRQVLVPVSSGRVALMTKGGRIELEPGEVGVYDRERPYLPPSRHDERYPRGEQPDWILSEEMN